jgi:hypothetical protein
MLAEQQTLLINVEHRNIIFHSVKIQALITSASLISCRLFVFCRGYMLLMKLSLDGTSALPHREVDTLLYKSTCPVPKTFPSRTHPLIGHLVHLYHWFVRRGRWRLMTDSPRLAHFWSRLGPTVWFPLMRGPSLTK